MLGSSVVVFPAVGDTGPFGEAGVAARSVCGRSLVALPGDMGSVGSFGSFGEEGLAASDLGLPLHLSGETGGMHNKDQENMGMES